KRLNQLICQKTKLLEKFLQAWRILNFLGYLNLSYNNLSGEIPSGTQLQSLEASSYIGNNLCGAPLTISYKKYDDEPQDRVDGNEKESNDDGAKIDEFYLGLVLGFVVGFWGIFGSLLYCRSWRHAYFQFLNKIWIKFYVMFNKSRY
ncbi:receptor-like protein EIX2, partial [Mercurialis annua]|uniref:receptor-like protein EIX2 n=1 Tax=Mercurialis annua TaxID=3986 RepID=UPI0024AE6014